MMVRWQEVKSAHKDCIVFYRLGDFYEMFFEDAEVASRALGLTLTGRDCGLEKRAPMCGVPFHAAAGYIKKLIEKGHRVAVCEQLTAPQKGKTLVQRDVTKIITAGTYNDENFLDGTKNNFVAAVYSPAKPPPSPAAPPLASIAWCDITTGEFFVTQTPADKTEDVLGMIAPRETITSDGHYGYAFNSATAYQAILRYFKITSTEVFDINKTSSLVNCAGALLEYLFLTQKQAMANVTRIRVIQGGEYMTLDKTARDNLELNSPFRHPNQKQGSLLWVLDDTKTAMGARLLASWLNKPLQSVSAVNERLDAVDTLVNESVTARDLRTSLSKIADISRLCGKVASRDILPRDFLAISRSLEQLHHVKQATPCHCERSAATSLLTSCHDDIVLLPDLADLISRAISPDAPAKLDDGGYIRDGFNAKLDEFRNARAMGHGWLSKLEATEREQTKIKELKVGFNRVAGYYFEVPTRHSASVPYRFTRKATTASTERFITAELKELEDKILNAQTNAIELETKLLSELRQSVLAKLPELLKNADAVAILDVLQSFAFVAIANNYVRPMLNEKGAIQLKDARHPVVEKLVGTNNYIPNDCTMGGGFTTMLITGPNMAGKSTYMRMVAHIVIMAHIGSFVPAAAAQIPLTDRVFTRIGASDSLLTGESTFMVEMNECANIVHNATKKSLVLLDEVGRGTGTSDGRALASSIITYITDKIGANTMFATHFHELTELGKTNPRIRNYKVLTEQIDGEIVFLHRVEQGIEENSFGIDVAKLAGLPKEVLDNARRIYNQDRAQRETKK